MEDNNNPVTHYVGGDHSNIVVDHDCVIQATIRRNTAGAPFIVTSFALHDMEGDDMCDGLTEGMGPINLRNVSDDPEGHSLISLSRRGVVDDTDRCDWIIRVRDEDPSLPLRSLNAFLKQPSVSLTPSVTEFNIIFALPFQAFDADGWRHFSVTVGLAKDDADPRVRYVTGQLTLDTFGVPSFVWEQMTP